VKTLADAKGMKIRVQQSDLWVALVGAMGANPTPMPIGEVYTGLKTGLIDAAENNIPSYDGFKHYEAVKFYSKTEHLHGARNAAHEQGCLRQAQPAEQQMIRKAAKDSVAFQRKKWDEEEIKSMEVVKKGGAQIVDVDKASFQAVMTPVYDKFMNTPDLKRLVKAVQDTK
jgi:TRAP-type C4-dicarboxylate transport system substrate-binding protein